MHGASDDQWSKFVYVCDNTKHLDYKKYKRSGLNLSDRKSILLHWIYDSANNTDNFIRLTNRRRCYRDLGIAYYSIETFNSCHFVDEWLNWRFV